MILGALVRKKANIFSYFEEGQINQVVEMQKVAGDYGIKVEILELDEIASFSNIKKKINIIHDKCYGQTKEEKIILKNFHHECKKEKIPIFNDYGLLRIVGNKWRMDKFLKNKKGVKKYIIPTILYNKKNVDNFLNSYNVLILKPAWGQEGTGVIEVRKDGKDILASYKIREEGKLKIKSEKIKSISRIDFLIGKIWRNKNYIVQPKIDSTEFKGNIFDIRLTLQKLNNWEVAGIGVRVANKGSFLCNIASGGEMFNGKHIIKEVFSKKSKTIIEELEFVATEIGKILEKNIDGIVAEIGFDFMIDKEEKIWLLEINSKPSPEIFYKKELNEIRERMTFWPIVFAKHYYGNKKQNRS